MAARVRTLPAAIAPVLVGTAAAIYDTGDFPRVAGFVVALLGSIFIQIGTNLANDYSDARRGADTARRAVIAHQRRETDLDLFVAPLQRVVIGVGNLRLRFSRC